MPNSSHTPKKRKSLGQAMLEFALALPVLLMVVYGLLETGRLLFIYASVVTAARQAARYGSASGDITGAGNYYYQDCTGIRSAAKAVGFLQRFNDSDIQIAYDTGPGTALINTGSGASNTDCPIGTISDNQHRIDVRVSTLFTPIVPLVPFGPINITSTSNRTIITGVSVAIENAGLPAASSSGGEITITKSPSRTTFDTAGQVITYTYTITNNGSGDVTGIDLFDSRIGGGTTDFYCGPDPLHGGAPTVTCTANYTVIQADVDSAAAIQNTATVRAFDSAGNPLAATVSASVAFNALPKLQLVKAGTPPAIIAAGNLVSYTFTLTNTGNIDLHSPYAINDPDLPLTNLFCPTTAMPAAKVGVPAGTVTCTANYALRNTNIQNGFVENTATATAKFGTTGTISSNQSTARVDTPKLSIALVTDKDSTGVANPGDVITYTFQLRNNTTSTIKNPTVTDTRTGASNFPCGASIPPNPPTPPWVNGCTRTYKTTPADFDAGSTLTNSATATGQGSVNSNIATSSVNLLRNPVIQVDKTSTGCGPGGQACTLNQQITYNYALYNYGNVTLTASATNPIFITDDKLTLPATCTLQSGSFGPDKNTPFLSCSQTYNITQADLDAGSITNTATGHATYPSATNPNLTSTKSLQVITFPTARLGLFKSADKTFYTALNDVITYSYALRNTGGLPLTITSAYTLTDTPLGSVTCPLAVPPTVIPVGGSISCSTLTHTVVQADLDAGFVTNTVTLASGANDKAIAPSAPQKNSLTVNKLDCSAGKLTGSTIPDGASTSWTITNNAGTTLHITGGTVQWNAGPSLQLVKLGTTTLWSGTSGGSVTLSGNWPLPYSGGPTVSTMTFQFSASASGIKVTLTFQEPGCALSYP